jgi:hypothetical protein
LKMLQNNTWSLLFVLTHMNLPCTQTYDQTLN